MLQAGRHLIDEESGALASKRYLIVDRDTKYTRQFRRLVEESGTEVQDQHMQETLNAFNAAEGSEACSTTTAERQRDLAGRKFGQYASATSGMTPS